MLGNDRIAARRLGCRWRRLLEVNASRGGIRILAGSLRILPGSLLARCRPWSFPFRGVYTIDGLLHERPTETNTSIDLLGQDLEAFVAENDRLALSRPRKRRDNGEMIASVQRDGFGDYPHVAFEVVESGVYAVETLAQQSFDRWRGVQKMLKSSFDEHALANTRSVACDVEPTADTLTQPNRYFATLRDFSSALWSNVNEIGLRLGQL